MLAYFSCPACGEDGRDVVESEGGVVACPGCGTRLSLAPVATEEDVTSWIGTVPDPEGPSRAGEAEGGDCLACGYSGPMLSDATMGDPACPACGASQRDRRIGRVRRLECPECGAPIDAERGRSVVCPHCKRFLGCLVPEEGRRHWWRRPG